VSLGNRRLAAIADFIQEVNRMGCICGQQEKARQHLGVLPRR
jgi:hypothetical protein